MDFSLLLGAALLTFGVAALFVAVFRAMAHTWSLGWYDLWLFPVAGLTLIFLGRWLIQ